MSDAKAYPIGFIGLGIMGKPMARNLTRAGFDVIVYNRSRDDIDALLGEDTRFTAATSPRDVAEKSRNVITMLPDSQDVRDVIFGPSGLLNAMTDEHLLIDMSTIAPATSVEINAALRERGAHALDAPVSGGDKGAIAGTLSVMVGGEAADFQRAMPLFEAMGKTIVHAGGPGNGQAAKICNNMVLGISMIAVSEAFVLAEKLGLDAQKLFDISSKSSGQCWSMTTYCPVPGPVPTSPANRDYQAGFTAAMMLKDLKLAQDAALTAKAQTPLGADAAAIYERFVQSGAAGVDFSGVIRYLRAGKA